MTEIEKDIIEEEQGGWAQLSTRIPYTLHVQLNKYLKRSRTKKASTVIDALTMFLATQNEGGKENGHSKQASNG